MHNLFTTLSDTCTQADQRTAFLSEVVLCVFETYVLASV